MEVNIDPHSLPVDDAVLILTTTHDQLISFGGLDFFYYSGHATKQKQPSTPNQSLKKKKTVLAVVVCLGGLHDPQMHPTILFWGKLPGGDPKKTSFVDPLCGLRLSLRGSNNRIKYKGLNEYPHA